MENPASWGQAERIIHQVRIQDAEAKSRLVMGWSLEHKIVQALREAGLLNEEQP